MAREHDNRRLEAVIAQDAHGFAAVALRVRQRIGEAFNGPRIGVQAAGR